VNLQFSVSGEDLSVRVEMHQGQVRTTFRTDSAELRNALAHEWQALAANAADRPHRFVDPVFSPGSSSFSQGGNAENQGNHRGQEMRRPEAHFQNAGRTIAATASGGASLAATLPTTVAPLTALRLHTFA
jgi:hypothetical protein